MLSWPTYYVEKGCLNLILGAIFPTDSRYHSAQIELNSTISVERMNEGIHYGDDGQPLGTTVFTGSYWHLLFSSPSPSLRES